MIRRKQRRAFTLIELLLVMVILAVLAGVAVPIYLGRAAEAKVNATKVSLANIKQALMAFEVDCERFPTTSEGLDSLVNPPSPTPQGWHVYMDKVPKDGWNLPFAYVNEDGSANFDLYSFGEDQQDGTADDIHLRDLN